MRCRSDCKAVGMKPFLQVLTHISLPDTEGVMVEFKTEVTELRIENGREPVGIDISEPRLSWNMETSCNSWNQQAYQVEAVWSGTADTVTTEKIASDQSVLVPWPFSPLTSRSRVSVRVKVWGSEDTISGWSEPLVIEAGLLESDEWKASFIAPAAPAAPGENGKGVRLAVSTGCVHRGPGPGERSSLHLGMWSVSGISER